MDPIYEKKKQLAKSELFKAMAKSYYRYYLNSARIADYKRKLLLQNNYNVSFNFTIDLKYKLY